MSLAASKWVGDDAPVKNCTEIAILHVLADYADEFGCGCWPSQATIAEKCAGISDRTVRRVLKDLEGRGVIRRGNQELARYIRADKQPIVWDLNLSVSRHTGGHGRPGGQNVRPDTDGRAAGHLEHDDRTPVSDDPLINHNEPSLNYIAQFGVFWVTYPRKVGKRKAQVAFAKACTRATPETIIAGATRLASDPNLPEKEFIPHPTTWLNRDGWEDEPLPRRNQPLGGRQNDETRRVGTSAQDWLVSPLQAEIRPDYAQGHEVIDL